MGFVDDGEKYLHSNVQEKKSTNVLQYRSREVDNGV